MQMMVLLECEGIMSLSWRQQISPKILEPLVYTKLHGVISQTAILIEHRCIGTYFSQVVQRKNKYSLPPFFLLALKLCVTKMRDHCCSTVASTSVVRSAVMLVLLRRGSSHMTVGQLSHRVSW